MLARTTLVLFTMFTFVGCADSGTGGKKKPARTAVSGIVMLDGVPIEGAVVTLHPVQEGNMALGITDLGGRFDLETFERADGVVPGEYQITVSKQVPGDAAAPSESSTPGAPQPTEPKQVFAAKYLKPDESGLTVTVGKTPIPMLELKLE